MSSTMNKSAFEKLMAENIEWLNQQPRTLERDHIIDVCRSAPDMYYGKRNEDGDTTETWDPIWHKFKPYAVPSAPTPEPPLPLQVALDAAGLAACPFCGQRGAVDGINRFRAGCWASRCIAFVGDTNRYFLTSDEAPAAWNTRVAQLLPAPAPAPQPEAGDRTAHWDFCIRTIDGTKPCNCLPPYARPAPQADALREAVDCPFCGKNAEVADNINGYWHAGCDTLSCPGNRHGPPQGIRGKKKALEVWNARAALTSPKSPEHTEDPRDMVKSPPQANHFIGISKMVGETPPQAPDLEALHG